MDASWSAFTICTPEKSAYHVKIVNRSEEHTSELQSHSDLVCRLLLEKKKKNKAVQILERQTCRQAAAGTLLIVTAKLKRIATHRSSNQRAYQRHACELYIATAIASSA